MRNPQTNTGMALHLLLQLVPGLATAWSGGSDAMPMPFPLPVNYSMGVCGNDPGLRPNCSTSMVFAINPTVHCSAKLGQQTLHIIPPLPAGLQPVHQSVGKQWQQQRYSPQRHRPVRGDHRGRCLRH